MRVRSRTSLLLLSLATLLAPPRAASAQSLAVSAQFAAAQWSEFDGAETGIGGRVTWMPWPVLGIDAGFTWYPTSFPANSAAPFSGRRIEGLFGVTAGPRLHRVRPFAKAAAGFLDVDNTPIAFACIAIFPPPL